MSEDREKYTTDQPPHVRHTTFGALPIGAKLVFSHRDSNSPNPWTKTSADTIDCAHQDAIPADTPVTWMTEAEVEAERLGQVAPSDALATRVRAVVDELHHLQKDAEHRFVTGGGTKYLQADGEATAYGCAVRLLETALAAETAPVTPGAGD